MRCADLEWEMGDLTLYSLYSEFMSQAKTKHLTKLKMTFIGGVKMAAKRLLALLPACCATLSQASNCEVMAHMGQRL